MSTKKSPRSQSTAKRHSAIPAQAKKPASKMNIGDAAIDAMAGATVAIMDAAVVTPSKSAAAPTIVAETPISSENIPTEVSKPAISSAKIMVPADAVEKLPAETSADLFMANTTSTAALVNSLRDASADVASDAAAALGASGDKSAVKPLSEVITNADGYFHPVVRAAAATSLGKLADKRAVPSLIAGIRDEMAEASAESIRALAAIGDARAVAPLIDVVRNAEGFYLSFVRRAAVLALVKLGGPEATSALRAVSENYDEDPIIRKDAADAIA